METEREEEKEVDSQATTITLKTEESSDVNNESFDQIDLKIEKDEILDRNDFYSNPNKLNKKVKIPIKNKKIEINYRYKRLGNTFAFWYNKEGDPLILIGPHCKKIIIFI